MPFCLPEFHLRNGIIFIGIMSLTTSITNVVLSSITLTKLPKSDSVGVMLVYAIMLMTLGLFELLLSGFLLNGICKYETAHLFVYLWLKIIAIILLVISMVLAFIVTQWIGVYCVVNLVCTEVIFPSILSSDQLLFHHKGAIKPQAITFLIIV
uniref:CSON002382 protein n=1 Tax=Culicoides sonorensis TaxID=179676 RepID=A0A336LIF1_CULSO